MPSTSFGCAVRELTPHAALGISSNVVGDPTNFTALYVEVISAPSTPVRKGTGNGAEDEDEDEDEDDEDDRHKRHKKRELRVADGLGIIAEASGNEKPLRLIHPGLFSLPSDDVVDGQRQAAIDCVCGELPEDSDPETFEDFGVSCPEKM